MTTYSSAHARWRRHRPDGVTRRCDAVGSPATLRICPRWPGGRALAELVDEARRSSTCTVAIDFAMSLSPRSRASSSIRWCASATSRRAGSELSHARRTFSPRSWRARRIELSVSLPVASTDQRLEPAMEPCDLVGVGGALELIDDGVHRGELVVGHPLSGESGRRWQQQPAHLEHLLETLRLQELHREHHAGQQLARSEAGHVGAVTAPDIEDVDLRQRPHGLAQRTRVTRRVVRPARVRAAADRPGPARPS